jgi:hypothetical protein
MTADYVELPARMQEPLPDADFQQWHTPDGEIVARFYRTAEGYLLRFPGRADFSLRLADRQVSCVPAPKTSGNILSALYFNQVLPLLRSLDGRLVVHASAASCASGALAFIGPSGRGKSTLAAGFARAGHPFLSDDGIWLERDGTNYMVAPHRPGLRLWPDSEVAILDFSDQDMSADYWEKSYRPSGPDLPFEDRARRLAALYVLGEDCEASIAIERLPPARAMIELVKHAFILDAEDRGRHQAHFETIGSLAEQVPSYTLDFPRRYNELPRVIEAVLAHAAEGANAA